MNKLSLCVYMAYVQFQMEALVFQSEYLKQKVDFHTCSLKLYILHYLIHLAQVDRKVSGL